MQVSSRLDSELSELEEALLDAHLARCAACRLFADDLETLTDTLRTAPLLEPSLRFHPPRRRTRVGIAHTGSAAAAAIVAAIALGNFIDLGSAPARISASDIQTAHDRMILKEQLMEEMDGATVRPPKRVPRGFEAAKNATVSPMQGAR